MTTSLQDAIDSLRTEIASAITRARNQRPDLVFLIKTIQLELTVVATAEGGGQGKVTWTILPGVLSGEVGGGGKFARAHTHRVVLSLDVESKSSDGARIHGSGRPPLGTVE